MSIINKIIANTEAINKNTESLTKLTDRINSLQFTVPEGIAGVSVDDEVLVIEDISSYTQVNYNNISPYGFMLFMNSARIVTADGVRLFSDNLLAENIKKDVNILGVTGTYEGVTTSGVTGVTYDNGELDIDGSSITNLMLYDDIQVDIHAGSIVIQENDIPVSIGYSGTVIATNLEPENIKKDTTILGVTGTYDGGITVNFDESTKTLTITEE